MKLNVHVVYSKNDIKPDFIATLDLFQRKYFIEDLKFLHRNVWFILQLIQEQLEVTISPEEILYSRDRIGRKLAPQSRDNRSIAVKLFCPDLKKKFFSEREEKRINDL